MSSQPIGSNDPGAGMTAAIANLYPHLIAFWLLAIVIWSIHLTAPELLGFSPDFLKYCEPHTPTLPIPAHVASALAGAVLLFATWTWLTSRDPRWLARALLLAAITTGIELLAARQTIWLRSPAYDIIADPDPDPEPGPANAVIDGIFNATAAAIAALVLLLIIRHGLRAIAASRHDRLTTAHELIVAYFLARFALGVSLALPLFDKRIAWSTVDVFSGPPLTWLVAAALPLGLGIACLLDRLRPRP